MKWGGRRQVVERRQQHWPEVDEDRVMMPVSCHVTPSRGRGRKSHGVCQMDAAERRFKCRIEAMCRVPSPERGRRMVGWRKGTGAGQSRQLWVSVPGMASGSGSSHLKFGGRAVSGTTTALSH